MSSFKEIPKKCFPTVDSILNSKPSNNKQCDLLLYPQSDIQPILLFSNQHLKNSYFIDMRKIVDFSKSLKPSRYHNVLEEGIIQNSMKQRNRIKSFNAKRHILKCQYED